MSPVLQGSLGNLCPLYILAGDGEVLRDEIIYIAHRAAHPHEFPTRQGVLRDGRRQRENAEKYNIPTKVRFFCISNYLKDFLTLEVHGQVHLQVFDGTYSHICEEVQEFIYLFRNVPCLDGV